MAPTLLYQFVEKLFGAVILSEAKNCLSYKSEILRRLRLLRMTALGEFFNKLIRREPSHDPIQT